jgi:glycosyltransferase involved in cell wall biosynthesis
MSNVLCVVLPLFRCQDSIDELLERLSTSSKSAQIEAHVVLVDDGSPDESLERGLSTADRLSLRATGLKLSRNFGQFGAILAGLEEVSSNPVVIMSADLQDPPEMIAQMYRQWRDGAEIVIAYRAERADSLLSSTLSRLAYHIAGHMYKSMPPGGFDFVLLSPRAASQFRSFRGQHRFFQGDILSLGYRTVFLPYKRLKRPYGRGGWSLKKRVEYFLDLVLDSSYAPIRIMSRLGFLVALLGAIYAVVIVGARFLGDTPFPGWAPIMVVQLVLNGTIMLMLGVSGEYLWRIYDDLKDRPRFLVDKRISNGKRDDA